MNTIRYKQEEKLAKLKEYVWNDEEYVFTTNFLDEDLELYQQAIVGVAGQILKNQPGFPYYNNVYPWTLWVQKSRRKDFWIQFEWMKKQKDEGVEYWWIKQ